MIALPTWSKCVGPSSAGLPAFPSSANIVLLYDRTAASPVSLFAAAALTTYNYTGTGDTTINHAQGVCLYNGESIEISGCTGDAALLNGTHTVITSASNTLTIATPLGLSPTVGAVSIPGTPVFNPVLRWVSQITDQSGNGFHGNCATRAAAIRWDASALEFVFPVTVVHNVVIANSSGASNAWDAEVVGVAGVVASVMRRTASIGQTIWMGQTGGSVTYESQWQTNTNFRQGLASSNLDYNNASNNLGDWRLFAMTHNAVNARAIYRDNLTTAKASNTNGSSPATNTIAKTLGCYSNILHFRGRMRGHVVYAGTALAGSGELAALEAAISARWGSYETS